MKVLVKKWIATYVDEANVESGEYIEPTPKFLKDDDGKVLVANTYDEIYSLVNDDIEYWQLHRPVPENNGFERKGHDIRIWDDSNTVYYHMEQIEIEIDVN